MEFSHRTVADFLTDTPEGRIFMARTKQDLWDRLSSRIDATMACCRLCQDRPFQSNMSFHIGIVDVLLEVCAVWQMTQQDLQAIKAIQGLKESVVAIASLEQDEGVSQSIAAVAEGKLSLASVSAASSRGYAGYDRSAAIDIDGVLLTLGCDVWFKIKQSESLLDSISPRRMTPDYMNYLLACAVGEFARHRVPPHQRWRRLFCSAAFGVRPSPKAIRSRGSTAKAL